MPRVPAKPDGHTEVDDDAASCLRELHECWFPRGVSILCAARQLGVVAFKFYEVDEVSVLHERASHARGTEEDEAPELEKCRHEKYPALLLALIQVLRRLEAILK